MKRIVMYTVVGTITLPIVIIIFGYTVGLLFRPEEMDFWEAFKIINKSTFSLTINSRTFLGSLRLWMPVG